MRVVRQPVSSRPAQSCAWNPRFDSADESVAQGFDSPAGLFAIRFRPANRRSESNYSRNIMSAAPFAFLLFAALYEGQNLRSAPKVKRADSLRPIELMR